MLSLELLDSIDRYLIGVTSPHDLEGWVVANLQRVMDSADPKAIRIANEIDALFVELGEGIINLDTLRDRLGDLMAETSTYS